MPGVCLFACLFAVCLSVSNFTGKKLPKNFNTRRIRGHWTRKNCLNFGHHPLLDHEDMQTEKL